MNAATQLELQVCRQCARVQYPVREVCRDCLSGELEFQPVDGGGELLSWCRLHASLEPLFQQRLPWIVVSVRLQSGPVVLAHWAGAEPVIGQAVDVHGVSDPEGRQVLAAIPQGSDPGAAGALFSSQP